MKKLHAFPCFIPTNILVFGQDHKINSGFKFINPTAANYDKSAQNNLSCCAVVNLPTSYQHSKIGVIYIHSHHNYFASMDSIWGSENFTKYGNQEDVVYIYPCRNDDNGNEKLSYNISNVLK